MSPLETVLAAMGCCLLICGMGWLYYLDWRNERRENAEIADIFRGMDRRKRDARIAELEHELDIGDQAPRRRKDVRDEWRP